jgi:hypothetical protein
MAYEGKQINVSFPASADYSANQYCAFHLNSSGQLVLSDDEADGPLGILQDGPAASGRAGNLAMNGSISKAQCSGTIAYGDYLTAAGNGTASGYLITTTTDTHNYVARALGAHTADGGTQILTISVNPGTYAG